MEKIPLLFRERYGVPNVSLISPYATGCIFYFEIEHLTSSVRRSVSWNDWFFQKVMPLQENFTDWVIDVLEMRERIQYIVDFDLQVTEPRGTGCFTIHVKC